MYVCMYIYIYIYIDRPETSRCGVDARPLSSAQRGSGVEGKGSWNETRALRTVPSGEKQGFQHAGGFLEPIAPLPLPCGALPSRSLHREGSPVLPPLLPSSLRPFFILRIVRPRIFESKFRNHCAKKLVGALRKPTSFM